MRISELNTGARAKVMGYGSLPRAYRQKLLQMGLIRGKELTLVRRAPLGDPVEISLDGFHMMLRQSEADALDIECLKP